MTELYRTSYDAQACDIGIVHIGYGAFHRAHQAVYVDDYMQATGDLRWGISAVNLRASESEAFRTAASANHGYVLKTIAPSGVEEFRLVRSHMSFADAAEDLDLALDELCRPTVSVASMTVTESGYSFADDWSLDLSAPPIVAELFGSGTDTIYGYLSKALARRADKIDAPITLLCCDNIRNNGQVLEGALLSYLEAAGQHDLAEWVRRKVTFPCSMVDRITPRATEALTEEVAQAFPDHRDSPIHAEAFTQWVLQDKFAADMPDLSRVGVQVVGNVEPYEEAKIRILNGGHTGLAYLGALAGHRTFDQAMRDPAVRSHFDRWETAEVLPGLNGVLPFDGPEYLNEIAQRFENAGIADQLERICMDGYSKMAIYVRPTLRACLAQGISPEAGYDCVASWVVYARKHQAGTIDLTYVEPFWDRLAPLLARGREQDLAQDKQLWGDLPEQHDGFVPGIVAAIQRMEKTWQG